MPVADQHVGVDERDLLAVLKRRHLILADLVGQERDATGASGSTTWTGW